MLFFEFAFLFVFLPITLLGYYAISERRRNGWLLLVSCVFYSASSLNFLPLLLGSTAVDYLAGARIAATENQAARTRWLLVSLVANLGSLAYFKYSLLISGTARAIFGPEVPLVEAALPIGISFYTFQSMSYTIDVYRRRIEPVSSFGTFGTYVTLFPQLIAGPIVRFAHIASQLKDRAHTHARFASGVFMFTVGLAKKILLADTFASAAAPIFGAGNPGFVDAWVSMALFAGQIYFDFSGYSDMAIGLGRMFGFEFPINFDSPYRAASFSEFWRRWHITLSTWLRDYLYIPLGGNQKGPIRTYVNLGITMLLGGLWHGASWNFLLWGAAHGALLAAERALFERGVPSMPRPLRIALVFAAVVLVWTPFKLETFAETLTWVGAMFGGRGVGSVTGEQLLALAAALAFIFIPKTSSRWSIDLSVHQALGAAALLLLSVFVGYGRVDPSPFLYFRF